MDETLSCGEEENQENDISCARVEKRVYLNSRIELRLGVVNAGVGG